MIGILWLLWPGPKIEDQELDRKIEEGHIKRGELKPNDYLYSQRSIP